MFVLQGDSSQTFSKETGIMKQFWEKSHLIPTEKCITGSREIHPVMSEMMSLQNIRCTAVRQHNQRPKSTLKIQDLEKFQKSYFSPFAAFREHSDDM